MNDKVEDNSLGEITITTEIMIFLKQLLVAVLWNIPYYFTSEHRVHDQRFWKPSLHTGEYMYFVNRISVWSSWSFFLRCDSLQEFGQSTPEIRKSGRKIPTLFKKRKLEREASSAKTSNKPVRYGTAPPGVNGGSYEDDSDNSAQGEYIEVKPDRDCWKYKAHR